MPGRVDLALLAAAALLVAAPAAALEGCDAPPRVVADVRTPLPVETRTRPGMGPPLGGHVAGLTQLRQGWRASYEIESIRRGDRACLRLSVVRVSAGAEPPRIWIRPDVAVDACRRKVTMDHELEHVRFHREHLLRFRAALERELPARLRGIGPLFPAPGEDPALAVELLEARVMREIARLHDASAKIAEERHAAIDSPESYRRLTFACR